MGEYFSRELVLVNGHVCDAELSGGTRRGHALCGGKVEHAVGDDLVTAAPPVPRGGGPGGRERRTGSSSCAIRAVVLRSGRALPLSYPGFGGWL